MIEPIFITELSENIIRFTTKDGEYQGKYESSLSHLLDEIESEERLIYVDLESPSLLLSEERSYAVQIPLQEVTRID